MSLQEARKRIPELNGLSDESALNVIHQVYYPNMDKADLASRLGYKAPQVTQEIKNPGFIRGMSDTVLALGQGVAGSAKSLTDLAGADNVVSQGLESASKGMEGLKSQESQHARQQHMRAIKAAEESGDTGAEIAAYANMIWDMPAESIAQGLGSFATLGVGKAAQAFKLAQSAKAAGMSKEAFLASQAGKTALDQARDVGFKTNLGVGMAQGVGAVKGSQFEQTYNNAIAQGMPPDQAQALATEAQGYGGQGTMQQMLGGGLGFVAAKTGPVERLVAGKGVGAGGWMQRTAAGFGVEGLTEGAQGAQERYAGNTAAIDAGVLDESKRLTGVAGQAVSEGMVGGVLGGGAGALGGSGQPSAGLVDPVPEQNVVDDLLNTNLVPETGPLGRAANAGTKARANTLAQTGIDPGQPNTPEQDVVDDPVVDQINQIPDEAERTQAAKAYAVLGKQGLAKGVIKSSQLIFDRIMAKHGLSLDGEEDGTANAVRPVDSMPNGEGLFDAEAGVGAAPGVVAEFGGGVEQPGVGEPEPDVRPVPLESGAGAELTAEQPAADQFEKPLDMVPRGVDSDTGEILLPAAAPEPLDFTGKTDEELQQARKAAQSPAIRKALATELQARRAAAASAAKTADVPETDFGNTAAAINAGDTVRVADDIGSDIDGQDVKVVAVRNDPALGAIAVVDAADGERYDMLASDLAKPTAAITPETGKDAQPAPAQAPAVTSESGTPADQTPEVPKLTQAESAAPIENAEEPATPEPADAQTEDLRDGIGAITKVITASIADNAIKTNKKHYAEQVANGRLSQQDADSRAAADVKTWSEQKTSERTERIAKAIAEKDPAVLVKAWASVYGSEGSIEAFRKLTGVNLKRTNSADRAKAIFDWAGWTDAQVKAYTEQRQAEKKEAQKQIEENAAKEKTKRTERTAANTEITIQGKDGKTTVKAYIDGLVEKGFTNIGSKKVGAITKTFLFNPKTDSGYPLQKGILSDYAKLAAKQYAENPANAEADEKTQISEASATQDTEEPYPEPSLIQYRDNGPPDASEGWMIADLRTNKKAPGYSSEKSAQAEITKYPDWRERGATILSFRWNDGGMRGMSPYAETTTRYAVVIKLPKHMFTTTKKSNTSEKRVDETAKNEQVAEDAPVITQEQLGSLYDYLREQTDGNAFRYSVLAKKFQRTADGTANPEAKKITLEWLQAMADDGNAKQKEAAKSKLQAEERAAEAERIQAEKKADILSEMKAGQAQNPNYKAFLDTLEQSDLDEVTKIPQMNSRFMAFTSQRRAEFKKNGGDTTSSEDLAKYIREYADKNLAARLREAEKPKAQEPAPATNSADTFEMGQDPMDILSGQQDIFSAPAEPEETQSERVQYPPVSPGAPAYLAPAQRAVVDFMNGDIQSMQALLEKFAELDLTEAQIRSVTNRIDITKDEIDSVKAMRNSAPAKPTDKIEDSGEVLEGARKLYAKSYAAKLDEGKGMDLAAVPLSKSWPEPDYQRLIDEGAGPWSVALARAVRDEVPTKPMKGWKLNGWVQKVEGLRAMAEKAMSGEITKDQFMAEGGRLNLADWFNKIDLYEAVGHANSLKTLRFSEGEYGMYGGQVFKPAKKLWTINMPGTSAPATWNNGGWGNDLVVADTKTEAIEKFKAWTAEQEGKEQDKPTGKRTKFDVYSYRNNPKVFIVGKRISATKSIDLREFESSKEAREFIAGNQAELEKLLAEAKTDQPERREENAPRVGDDHRNGADVTTEQFRETFGFRGEQFGASMPQAERQANMNQAYDALMDLAGVIGVPPKALSLNGELGLAFGARGHGGKNPAMAHYEPDTTGAVTPNRVVINLTRKNGAGSLAHEWFHAVDNYFARLRGEKGGMLTESYPAKREGVRPEMVDAFKRVMSSIQATGVRERAKNLDKKRTKDYWSTGIEMAARSFESYVIAKLQDKSGANDYLANILPESAWLRENEYPYPTMGELPLIRAAFDNFFATVQTKVTDKGVAMFSRSPATQQAYEARIDALFAGEKASRTGVTILDSSDVMGLLEYSGVPLVLNEAHVAGDGQTNHPEMTAKIWKKIPEWIENPAAVYTDPKHPGRLTLVAPSRVAGYPVVIAIEPDVQRGKPDHLLVTAFAKTTGVLPPMGVLASSGRLLYADTKMAPEIWSGIGDNPRPTRLISGANKILTEKNLSGYRKAQDPATSRGFGDGMTKADAQDVVDSITSRWANAPEVVVVQDMQDAKVPDAVRKEVAKQKSQGASGEPEGFWHGGKAYIVAGALQSPGNVMRVLFHETLGHHGLRGTFGDGLAPILKQLAALRRSEVEAKAKQYGLDMSIEADRLTAAEEVLAEMAQSQPNIGFVKRAIAAIRAFLRNHVPGFAKMKMTDEDIIANFIMPARAFVERGPGGGMKGGVSFSRGTNGAMPSFDNASGEFQDTSDSTVLFNGGHDGYIPVIEDRSLTGLWPGLFTSADVSRAQGPGGGEDITAFRVQNDKMLEDFDGLDYDDIKSALIDLLPERVADQVSQDEDAFDVLWRAVVDDSHHRVSNEFNEIFDLNDYEGSWEAQSLRGRLATKLGFDAVAMADEHGQSWYIRPGIKSIPLPISNDQSAPVSGGAMFSRSIGATELAGQVRDKLFDVSGATGNTLAHYRGMALRALGRRQLVDLYGDMLPQLKQYDNLVQRMDAEKNDSAAEADAIANEWGKLDEKPIVGPAKNPGMERKLADLMHDATLAQMDPDKPLQNGDNASQHAALKAKFEALSPQAKSVYRRARDMYEGHYAKVREAIQERIMRSELGGSEKKAMIAKMDKDFFQKTKGVYFPLARFGKYVMVVKDADGKTVNVSRADTLNEAETTRKMLLREFDKADGFAVTKVMKEAEFNRNRDMVGKGFVADLFAMLDKQGMDAALRDSVSQLYLSSLPDLSWAKHGIHRKGTPGFSQDARRAFAQNMFHGARYLAKLRYADQLQNQLTAMDTHIKANEGVDEYDGVKAQQVADEMAKRHDNLMSPDSHPLSTALTSVGFVWYLGVSPAAAMVNLTQTALVAYPVMGAKWGYDKAGVALLQASKETVQAKNDISKVLKGDELEAYNRAVADGTIDVTMAHDLAGISQGEDAKVTWALRPVMKVASFMFHHAERFNRQATFIASYRLARESGAGLDAAFEQAKKATYDGHFDYSACVDDATEILTKSGWKRRDELRAGDIAIATDKDGKAIESKVLAVNVYEGEKEVIEFESSRRFSMVLTPNHDAVIQNYNSRDKKWQAVRKVRADELKNHHFIVRTPLAAIERDGVGLGDDMAALLGWIVAEGWYSKYRKTTAATDVRLGQSVTHNPEYVTEIRGILQRLGGEFKEYTYERKRDTLTTFVLRRSLGRRIQEQIPEKVLTPELLASMSTSEMRAFLMAFLKGDGTRYENGRAWAVGQKNGVNLDLLQAMATMCGMRATLSPVNSNGIGTLYVVPDDTGARSHVRPLAQTRRTEPLVWCPTTEHGTWIARRNGAVFVTGNSNRPRIMQGNVAKVVLLFKQYGQNMVYTMSRQAYLATQSLNPKERAEARKQLGGMLALHAAAAGALGLPLVEALLSAASFIGSDDDEPWDAEVALKNMMADAMGPKAAEVMAHGLSRLTPWDLSGRVALNKLILPDVYEGLEGQRWAEAMSSAMLGPVWGIVTGAAKGLQDMGEGRYQRGLENMLPVALRNPVKALRYQEEGAIDKTGVAIKDEVSMAGVLGQVSGFSPSEVRAATEVKSAIFQHDRARMDRRKSLMAQFAQAKMAGDTEGMQEIREAIAKFNAKNPKIRITPRNLIQSIRNRERRIEESDKGVYLPRNRRDAIEAVRFGA